MGTHPIFESDFDCLTERASEERLISFRLTMKLLPLFAVAALSEAGKTCFEKEINDQINLEQEASLFYQALAYKFSTQKLNRPNFAKMCADRAAEEREHGHVLAEFQQERGVDVTLSAIQFNNNSLRNIDTIKEALDAMIKKEVAVTDSLKRLNKDAEDGVTSCENNDDPVLLKSGGVVKAPHLSDLMTGTYLPEQYKDINELRTHQKRLSQFKDDELLFDRLMFE